MAQQVTLNFNDQWVNRITEARTLFNNREELSLTVKQYLRRLILEGVTVEIKSNLTSTAISTAMTALESDLSGEI